MNPEQLFNKSKTNKNFELKKLHFSHELTEYNVTNFQDALNLIKEMKNKILEYEDTNNQNIETSIGMINDLREENEFYKKKLIENYDNLNEYVEEYGKLQFLKLKGDDLLNKHKYFLIEKFKKKWASKKIFNTLKLKNKENKVNTK